MQVIHQVLARYGERRIILLGTTLLAFLIFLAALQGEVNGSSHPYATDVGEIQNALPRWGTLHFTGYPQYSALGSLFVTLLRPFFAPAASASLFSAVWGAAAIALLFHLMRELKIPALFAAGASLLFALSTSMWVDAAIAEVHTMTMALTFAALIAAVRFGRDGQKRDLYWLAFLAGQGVAHQRAFAFLGVGLLLLVVHRWRAIWEALPAVVGLGLLGPLTYIYLPVRAWMGADWTFSSPGTWEGFRAIVLDTKAERIIEVPRSVADWLERGRSIVTLLNDDWPWFLWVTGLLGLLLPNRSWQTRLGLMLSWLPYLVISLIIWEGSVSDALLAVKMPVIALSAVGWGCWLHAGHQKWPASRWVLLPLLLLIAGWLFIGNLPKVLAVTRANETEATLDLARRIPPDASREQTLMALWGHDYWALTYAQAYEEQFPHLQLVDHDTDFAAILARGDRLMTLSRTLYQRPLSWWEDVLNTAVFLTAAAPEIVELKTTPEVATLSTGSFDLGNGIHVRDASLFWLNDNELQLSVTWQAATSGQPDYHVAVHLVTKNPPTGPQDIIAQADQIHPVSGWYPTSRWLAGEVVVDHIVLPVPDDAAPAGVRVATYRVVDGEFENSNWLVLPVPERP